MSGSSPPVIVIGMHRSGTSLAVRMLEYLGVFMGWHQESNREATFFLRLNDWLLRQAGASWDDPEGFHRLAANPDLRSLCRAYLELSLSSFRAVSYLGPRRYLDSGRPANLSSLWGWKDPRNTFTLPLWLDVFPNARVLHVVRHGVDVAQSIKLRYERDVARASRLYARRKLVYKFFSKRTVFVDTLRGASLEDAFALWEEYVDEARLAVRHLGERGLELRYESVLDDPGRMLTSLASFCGLSADDRAVQQFHPTVDVSRAYAYRRVPELAEFAEDAAGRLEARGYGAGRDSPEG